MGADWTTNLFQPRVSSTEEQQHEKKRRSSQGGCKQCRGRHHLEQNQLNPLGLGVVVATSLYCGVKAGIQVCLQAQLCQVQHVHAGGL